MCAQVGQLPWSYDLQGALGDSLINTDTVKGVERNPSAENIVVTCKYIMYTTCICIYPYTSRRNLAPITTVWMTVLVKEQCYI